MFNLVNICKPYANLSIESSVIIQITTRSLIVVFHDQNNNTNETNLF